MLTALLMAGAPAHAASTSAAITDIRYQLIDLDLTDNVTPTFTITYTSIYNDALYTFDDTRYEFDRLTEYGNVTVTGPHGASAAGSSQTGIFSNAAYVSPTGEQKAVSGVSYQLGFTLSPNTGLLVSARGTLASHPVTADVEASIYASGTMEQVINGVRDQQDYANAYNIVDGASAHTLRGYLATGSEQQQGYLFFRTDTNVLAAPVPEPATYGMLLAGALIIGAAARRKHARA